MTSYRFRLDTLLKMRVDHRQQKRAELAEAYQAEGLLNQQAKQLALEQETIRRAARISTAPGTIDIDALVSAHRYELLLETQQKLLAEHEAKLREEIERRRTALVEADRQVRVLEKLRERQREAHLTAEWKQELKELDEMAQRTTRREQE